MFWKNTAQQVPQFLLQESVYNHKMLWAVLNWCSCRTACFNKHTNKHNNFNNIFHNLLYIIITNTYRSLVYDVGKLYKSLSCLANASNDFSMFLWIKQLLTALLLHPTYAGLSKVHYKTNPFKCIWCLQQQILGIHETQSPYVPYIQEFLYTSLFDLRTTGCHMPPAHLSY